MQSCMIRCEKIKGKQMKSIQNNTFFKGRLFAKVTKMFNNTGKTKF